jgi:hypothetical protein
MGKIQMALSQYSKVRVQRHNLSEGLPFRIISRSNVEKMQHMALDADVDGDANKIDLIRAAQEFMHPLFNRAVGDRKREMSAGSQWYWTPSKARDRAWSSLGGGGPV